MLIGYFGLFIIDTGCLSEQLPQKMVSCYGGYCKHTGQTNESPPGSLTCSVYSTITKDLGLTSHLKDY